MATKVPSWIVDFPPPDPNSTTRDKYTEWHTKQNCPTDADATYQKSFNGLKALYDALAKHEAMVPNLSQTYSTPANSKNQVYFMWDFIGRTYIYLLMVDPYEPTKGPDGELWKEVRGRTTMGTMMITNPKTPPGPGENFGAEIERMAADLRR